MHCIRINIFKFKGLTTKEKINKINSCNDFMRTLLIKNKKGEAQRADCVH